MDISAHKRLLVLSDMHLGRDCNEITGFSRTVRPSQSFDQAFIDLLEHYTAGSEKEWRLIFAGDFIDFVEVVVVPDQRSHFDLRMSFQATHEENTFGLGSEAERSLVKLEQTLDYHEPLFRRLATFIREGGEVVILRGNHDTEFYWRKVQRVLRRKLASFAYAGMKLELDETLELRNQFQDQILFAPWVYIEPGRIYIEHGHQYDAYCSYDHQLYPVSPTNPREIDTPVFAFAMRYFVNMLSDYAAHNADVWSFRDYMRWLHQKGPSGMLYTVKMGFGACVRLIQYASRFAFGRVRRYGQEQNKKLKEEAQRYSVHWEDLQTIDRMRHAPVNRNLQEMMSLLFLDRFLLILASLFFVLLILLFVSNVWVSLFLILVVGTVAYQVNKKLIPWRFLLPGPKQVQAAKKIVDIMKVPLVVMGHSHARRMVDLGNDRRYVNTGCWLPPLEGKEHSDPEQPCSCKLSHLIVEDAPELRVFCKAAKTVRLADILEKGPD